MLLRLLPTLLIAVTHLTIATPSHFLPPDTSVLTYRADTPANCTNVDFKTCPKGCMQYMQPRDLFQYYLDCVCGCNDKIRVCERDAQCKADRCASEDRYVSATLSCLVMMG
jgi:hypothetical protein